MKMKYILTSLAAVAAIGMTGCWSSNSDDDAKAYNGVFVDDAVQGVTFNCGSVSGVTDAGGHFGTCPAGSTVEFSIGNLVLGSSSATNDGVFFVTDIVGVARGDISNETVTKIAVVLQSLDSDGDPSNGITVPSEAAAEINKETEPGTNLQEANDFDVVEAITIVTEELKNKYPDMEVVDPEDAQKNLANSEKKIKDGDFKPKDVTGSN